MQPAKRVEQPMAIDLVPDLLGERQAFGEGSKGFVIVALARERQTESELRLEQRERLVGGARHRDRFSGPAEGQGEIGLPVGKHGEHHR
jgi:hypothetical protein